MQPLPLLPHPAGDSTGSAHLLSLAAPAAPALLASQRVLDADVTSLACAAAANGQLLLAAGSRRGTVKVLLREPDGFVELASLADHKAAVTGVLLGSCGTTLHTATADGQRLTYSLDASKQHLQLAAQATVPRGSFVGLALALDGQAAVAASRAGRLYWEAAPAGKEVSVAALQKTQGEAQRWVRQPSGCSAAHLPRPAFQPSHFMYPTPIYPAGELAAFAVDPSLSLAVCATNRNQLLALGLAGGKPAPLAACKAAHAAGAAVTKVGGAALERRQLRQSRDAILGRPWSCAVPSRPIFSSPLGLANRRCSSARAPAG